MKCFVVLFFVLFNYNVIGQIKVDNVGDGWVDKVNQAITLIKKVDSEKYDKLIEVCDHVTFWNGNFSTSENDHTIMISQADILRGSVNNVAAVLVHESRHLMFRKLGIKLERRGDDIFVPAQDNYEIDTFIDGSILTIADAPWPGFTPDLLSIILVVATQAKGSVLIHQKMFESRLFFVDKLIDMGAKIMLCDPHRAVVMGHNFQSQLKATTMSSPDIRAGISLLIAALSATGTSTIHNIEQIDRGYERIDERLRAIGAKIERIEN